jgi:NADP-dependent 3-hydroxy acid dehydrogenase YdfG
MSGERHALVTGVSSGIGAAIARHLLETGWRVTGVSRSAADLASPAYRHLPIDLGRHEDIAGETSHLIVDALVHAAGFLSVGRLGELDAASHEKMWRVHVLAADAWQTLCCHAWKAAAGSS